MVQSSLVAATIGGIIGAVVWYAFLRLESVGVAEAYIHGLLALVTGLLFLVFSERLVTELIVSRKARVVVVLGALIALVLLSIVLGPAVVTWLLLIYLAFSLFDLFKKNTRQKELLVYESLRSKDSKAVVSERKAKRPFKYKPNVYLLFLESIHSEKGAEQIYNIPPDPEMAIFYQKHKFTVYDNFFSNNAWTLHSLNSLIENKLNAIISELSYPPYVFNHFMQNGYKINIFDRGTYVFGRYSKWADYCSFFLPLWIKRLYGFCGSLFAQSSFLRKAVCGVDLFETGISFDYTYSAVEQRLKIDTGYPVFNIIRFGARHNDYNFYSYKAWEELYVPIYIRTQGEIKRMVELIVSHDPKALIIATGDHGAMQYLDMWANGDINENIAKKGLTHDLVARSFFDVLLAVRWPDWVAVPPKIYTHINIFKHLFAILCEDKSILSEMKADISQKDNFLVADKGRPLKQFQHVGSGLLDYDIEEAEKTLDSNPEDKGSQIQLAELLLKKSPVKAERILKDVLKQGPDFAAESMLGNLFFEQNRIDEAKNIYSARVQKEASVDDYLKYATILKALGKPDEALGLLLDSKKQLGAFDPQIASMLISLYFYLGRYDDGINFYRSNYKVEKNENSLATLLYFKLLFHKEEFEKIDQYFSLLPSRSLRILLNLSVYNIGFTLINMRRKDWSAPLKAYLAKSNGIPDGGWSSFASYYCLEKQGDLKSVTKQIFEHIGNNARYSAQLAEYLGKLLIRNNIRSDDFKVFTELAANSVEERFLEYKKAGIFDEVWYKNKYLKGKSGAGHLHPIMHYQYYGMYEGACPNKYFDTYHYIESVRDVFQQGIDPLWHYLHAGTWNLVDPSLTFCTRRYMYEHKIPLGGQNPIVHLLAQERSGKTLS